MALSLFFAANTYAYPMPALSKRTINEKFSTAEDGWQQRWHDFSKKKIFTKYNPEFDDDQIRSEFEKMCATRNGIYYENPGEQPLVSNPDYERSQELLTGRFYKAPHLIAFAYNMSHPCYNSSNIILNGFKFLALEGPQRPDHVDQFKKLLINYNVQQIVRLTSDLEDGVFKSENYWDDNTFDDEYGNKFISLTLNEEEKRKPYIYKYYALDNWADHTGADPNILLDLVQQVRNNHVPGEIIAVHCSAGVGRTGTFIAALLLLDQIDKQLDSGISAADIELSIQELVYKITLQRAYLVGERSQYLTLHKLVRQYLTQRIV